eukprot:c21019_g1_i1 orf=1233-4313(+)
MRAWKVHEENYSNSMESTRRELQQQHLVSENLLQEKMACEKALKDKTRVFSKLECDHWALESEVRLLDEKVKSLLMVESTLQEAIEGQKLIQEGEQELLMTYIDQQMKVMRVEVETQQATREEEVSSLKIGGPSIAEMVDNMIEVTWKADTEALIVQVVMDGWYKEVTEVLHKLTFELAWKDEEIFYRDGELGSLKQAVEELENDYATLMSICLTLIRDQTVNDSTGEPTGLSVHELGRRKLLELSEFLSSRDMSGGQEEKSTLDSEFEEEVAAKQLQQDLKLEIVSEVLKQERPLEASNSREVCGEQERESSLQLEPAEQLASQQLQHELELDIVSEVLLKKYQEAFEMGLDSKFNSFCDRSLVETNEKKSSNNFEELEAHLESFLELEACRLERIRTGCSTSIAKCEFKLDNLMKNLAAQVNEMKAKISFVQDAIKQQEWKHMFEEDILVLVLWDALAEMHRNLKLEESSQQVQDGQIGPSISLECLKSPLDSIGASISSGGIHSRLEIESQRSDRSQQIEGRLEIQDKDKLILFLKRQIEELRKEKAVLELKLDEITEELYSLKRQFWKEKEIWVSKLSQPQRKEVEAQVDALSRHSSATLDLEEEFKKSEKVKFDALVSGLRKEWLKEKESLLTNVSQKEATIEGLELELARLKEREKDSSATEAGHLVCIAELKLQADNLSSDKLNQEFHFAKCMKEWQSEKESMRKEIDSLLEKDHGRAVSEAGLSARIAELETQTDCLLAQITELETEKEISRLARLDHDASFLNLKKQYEEERERLMRVISEKQDLVCKVDALSEQGKHNARLIEELEVERARLTTECSNRESSAAYLTQEKEIAFALAIKEKREEEKKREVLESQLQGLRLELKNLQSLKDKVADLQGKLEAVPRQLELKLAQQIGQSVKASQDFEKRAIQMMQEKFDRLDRIKEKCRILKCPSNNFCMKEAQYEQRLAKELKNLQKAEAEVDLLGDEVESLLDILEEVHATFDRYAPVLLHYPRMNEVAKIVEQEIQLRIDPKYGV